MVFSMSRAQIVLTQNARMLKWPTSVFFSSKVANVSRMSIMIIRIVARNAEPILQICLFKTIRVIAISLIKEIGIDHLAK